METLKKEKVTKTVWITKYALTSGIYSKVVECTEGSKYVYTEGFGMQQFVLGRDAFYTRPEAVVDAKAKAKKKVAALQKQIAKIQGLDFSSAG